MKVSEAIYVYPETYHVLTLLFRKRPKMFLNNKHLSRIKHMKREM